MSRLALNDKIRIHNEKVWAKLVSTEMPTDPRFIDLTGQVLGRWSITGYGGRDKYRESYFWCQCECGSAEKLVWSSNLRKGKSTSCGCFQRENMRDRSTTHGLTNDPWYTVAKDQQQRMTDPNCEDYPNYGGRGLVFGEGMETIEERVLFYREFFGPEPPEGLQVDRYPDNDRGYAKDNVRLATPKEQADNKRNSHGHTGTSEYSAWQGMKRYHKDEICKEWFNDFKQFYADMGKKPEGYYAELKRHNELLPFSKENCYWRVAVPTKDPKTGKISLTNHAYSNMKRNPENVICEEWLNDWSQFYYDMGEKPAGSGLRRYDKNKPFSKDNCYWKVTIKETV